MSKLKYHEAYNQRDVLSLKPVTQWTASEEQTHLAHNRILQPNFTIRDGASIIQDAKLTGTEWLTDICSPSVPATLVLHLGKEMVVNYKVGDEDLNKINHQAYNKIIEKNPQAIDYLEKKINEEFATKRIPEGDLSNENLNILARERLTTHNEELVNKKLEPIAIDNKTIEGAVLRSTIRQIHAGGIKSSLEQVFKKGDHESFKDSVEALDINGGSKSLETKNLGVATPAEKNKGQGSHTNFNLTCH